MTLKEFYSQIGGDYEGTKARFLTEERMLKFALKFETDPSFSCLNEALKEGRIQDAFRAAHTLKGVCQNLGFDALYRISAEATEVLRAGNVLSAELLNGVKTEYGKVIAAIGVLKTEA